MLMLRAWNVDPATMVRPVSRNLYLIEFVSEEERRKVGLGGPWTFRGDLVATRRVYSHSDLKPEHIGFSHLWVQFFGLPVNCLTEEGLHIMGSDVGTPVTPPVEGFINGRRFIKMKIFIDLGKPFKDHVMVGHPILGDLKVYCVYEKITRACLFCGELGHELHGCYKRVRVAELLQGEVYGQQYDQAVVLAPKKGPWILNPSLLPREHPANSVPDQSPIRPKRTYSHSDEERQPVFGSGPLSVHSPLPQPQSSSPTTANNSVSQPLKRPTPAGPKPPAVDI